MLTHYQDAQHREPWWVRFWKILEIAFVITLLGFAFTHGPLIDRFGHQHATVAFVTAWVVGMLSYHQDAKCHDLWWAVPSQTLAVACMVVIVVFGFAHGLWANFLIAPPLAWLHVQFTKRWWRRPGAWW